MTVAPDYCSHFGNIAAHYDELRPEDPSDAVIEVLVRDGDLAGRRILAT